MFSTASRFHVENTLIKNLDILLAGRNIQDMVIVDNRSANYCDHVLNGIPISDYNGEKDDTGLYKLQDYLMNRILHAEDVRTVIKEDFMDAVLTPANFHVQIHNQTYLGNAQSTLGGPPPMMVMPLTIKVLNPVSLIPQPLMVLMGDKSVSVKDQQQQPQRVNPNTHE